MIRLLLVDEVRLMGNAFVNVLSHEPDMEVVGCATTVDEALSLVAHCNMLLVSATLPKDGALELTRTVARTHPFVRVVIVGLSAAKADILRYVEAGATGYVLKEDSLEAMLVTLRAAHSREALVSPDMAAVLISRIAQLAEICKSAGARTYTPPMPSAMLTPREREVLRLVAQDLSNADIAERLTIELGTVKNHVHNILAKLNVSSRRDAITFFAQRRSQASAQRAYDVRRAA